MLLGGLTLGTSPFNVIQLLWINLIMDTFAALALATEPPSESMLREDPASAHDRIITPVMWRTILSQVLYQVLVMITLLYFGPHIFGIQCNLYNDVWYEVSEVTGETIYSYKCIHYTIMFNTFVWMQLFNEINARKLERLSYNVFENFLNNWLFLLILVAQGAAQWFIIMLGGKIARCAPLDIT